MSLLPESCSQAMDSFRDEEASPPGVLVPLSACLSPQHHFLVLPILYLSEVAAESVFTRHSLMLHLDKKRCSLRKCCHSLQTRSMCFREKQDCDGPWVPLDVWEPGACDAAPDICRQQHQQKVKCQGLCGSPQDSRSCCSKFRFSTG